MNRAIARHQKKKRAQSSIINLRIFHNWVKKTLLSETTQTLRQKHKRSEIALLDLAVGRGGDLYKWWTLNIDPVVGFDISAESINGDHGAKDRYRKLVDKLEGQGKSVPTYEFHVMDLSERENIPKIDKIIDNRKFDIVSCQFAIHYFFKTEETLDTFLTIVNRYITKDGFFIGTTMDGNEVYKMFTEGNIIKKKLYSLENKMDLDDTLTSYGNMYLASLGEKEGETHYFVNQASEEYMVDTKELQKVCKKHGLKFVGYMSFSKWYDRYLKTNPQNLLSQEEKEFSFLNMSFIFQKQ